MRQKGKSLSIVLCAVLILVSTVAGTLAYFTDSEAAVNTFTVGKVGITLAETSANDAGENNVLGTPEGTGFEYTLIPGLTYAKKPVVTVNADSEDAYVRMKVTVTNHAALLAIYNKTSLAETDLLDWDTVNWTCQGEPVVKDDVAVYEFRYNEMVKKPADTTAEREPLPALFTTVKMPGATSKDQMAELEGLEIRVAAHAIQAAGFDDADGAWTAFDAQHK